MINTRENVLIMKTNGNGSSESVHPCSGLANAFRINTENQRKLLTKSQKSGLLDGCAYNIYIYVCLKRHKQSKDGAPIVEIGMSV